MRRLLIFLSLLAVACLGVLMAGESWLADSMTKSLADDPEVTVHDVTPLRAPLQFGVELADLQIEKPGLWLRLPQLQLALSLLRPGEWRAGLPESIDLRTFGPMARLDLTRPDAVLDLALLRGGALRGLHLSDTDIRLDGQPLLGALDLALSSAAADAGSDLPGYDLTLHVAGLDLPLASRLLGPALQHVSSLPDQIDIHAAAQLRLDQRPALFPSSDRVPQLHSVLLHEARIAGNKPDAPALFATGWIEADESGHASGVIALYLREADKVLDIATATGWLSSPVAKLVRGVMKAAARAPLSENAAALALRPAVDGELRLLLEFDQGQTIFAGMPIGPAPLLTTSAEY